MSDEFAIHLASCKNFNELARLLTLYPFTDKTFDGCLLASVDNDGRIREIGRYGIEGSGPSRESVALASEGLVARALRGGIPAVENDLVAKAEQRLVTPESDIDDLVIQNGFESTFMIPLVDSFYSYGVIGLVSTKPVDSEPVWAIDHDLFQALLSMALRSISHRSPSRQPSQPAWGHELNGSQKEVLAFLAQDKSNKEIAESMSLSISTVKLRVSELLTILGVETRKEAGIKARYSGLY